MYIIVPEESIRKYSMGKIMAHAAHNAGIIIWRHKGEEILDNWFINKMTKVVLKTSQTIKELLDDMTKLYGQYFVSMITDIHDEEPICAAIGPINQGEANFLGFDKLKLL